MKLKKIDKLTFCLCDNPDCGCEWGCGDIRDARVAGQAVALELLRSQIARFKKLASCDGPGDMGNLTARVTAIVLTSLLSELEAK